MIVARGGFWRASVRDDPGQTRRNLASWPRIIAVVPARNEAEVIAESLGSLLTQDYPGFFAVVLVDDQSTDDTAAIGRAAAARARTAGSIDRRSRAAAAAGLGRQALGDEARRGSRRVLCASRRAILLFTDADIAFSTRRIARLVARAEAGNSS